MKKLLLVTLIFWCAQALGSVALVQASTVALCGTSATACAATAFGSSTTAGHAIVACYGWFDTVTTGYALSSVTDTGANSYTVITNSKVVQTATTDYTEEGGECAYTTGSIAGGADTVTCHDAAGPHYSYCNAYEISGQTSSSLDNTAGTTGTGSSVNISAGSFTTSVNGEFGVNQMGIDDGIGASGIPTVGAGWTFGQNTGNSNYEMGCEYQAQATAGSITGNATNTGATGKWFATMVVFKPTAPVGQAVFGGNVKIGGNIVIGP